VAIVGARNASAAGLAHARTFACALAQAGFAITSGMADGIDGAAHTAALDAGAITLAVVGTGPDRVYPRKHHALAQRIAANGAMISEFAPGTAARADHFPRRNRIISGLALGTLVVEAGLQSGSLITARLAGEQGREVFALPGSIHNPLARGCHRLIRDGVQLVESPAEIIETLAPATRMLGGELAARLSAKTDIQGTRVLATNSNAVASKGGQLGRKILKLADYGTLLAMNRRRLTNLSRVPEARQRRYRGSC